MKVSAIIKAFKGGVVALGHQHVAIDSQSRIHWRHSQHFVRRAPRQTCSIRRTARPVSRSQTILTCTNWLSRLNRFPMTLLVVAYGSSRRSVPALTSDQRFWVYADCLRGRNLRVIKPSATNSRLYILQCARGTLMRCFCSLEPYALLWQCFSFELHFIECKNK